MATKDKEPSGTKVLKRNSYDIGWEYGSLVDPNKLDRTQCRLCNKCKSGGAYRLKQHIAGVQGNVTGCQKATKDDQMRVRNALNENHNRKKAKLSSDESLRAEVKIGRETIDLDDCFGEFKEPRSFGPINRFATSQGVKGKQSNLNNVVRKEQVVRGLDRVKRGLGATLNVENQKRLLGGVFSLGAAGLAVSFHKRSKYFKAKKCVYLKESTKKKFGVTKLVNPKYDKKPVQEVIVELTNRGLDRSVECTGHIDARDWGVVLVGFPHKDVMFKTSPMNLLNERILKRTFFELEKFIKHEIYNTFDLLLQGEGLCCTL
ncbi:hypothetical protein M8C21_033347 [Ambrosia artemisiifolia]|uniref:alcohol dehydrogenase n=1 Tax=Ambrosia artemisiifolia TaxID=4212 RepID=A0AAD5GF59_AMBAR|nr:hypothetical protein M8C21_033347 [Ambrosia artemisiifolia]